MIGSNDPSGYPTLPEISAASNILLSSTERELLQNIYRDYQKIILQKEFGEGFSKTRVLLVLPVKPDGTSDAGIVTKIGPVEAMRREKENYEHYAKRALPFTATPVGEYCEHGDQAALNYVFAGGVALGKTLSLEDCYHAQTAETVTETLNTLLDKALGETWYGQNLPLNTLFRDEYGRHLVNHEELERIVKLIYPRLSLTDDKHIQIPGVTGTYLDPLKLYPNLLNKTLKGRRSFVHGDLHVRNVLVDSSGKAWLIDFAKIKQRHNLFDFIKLETYLRLMPLAQVAGDFSLNEYAQFEGALNAAALGQKTTPPAKPQLEKAYYVIRNIRQIARKYMGPEPDFKGEYFPALFLYSLAMLKYLPNDGIDATRLIFLTACSLAVDIFKEHETMPTKSSADQNLPKKEQAKPKQGESHTAGRSNVSIGGNVNGSVIVAGNQNKVSQTNQKINTGGGTYVGGSIHVQNGDFVGRDKVDQSVKVGDISNATGIAIGHGAQANITQISGALTDEITEAFIKIMQSVNSLPNEQDKSEAAEFVKKLEAEAKLGEQAQENRVQRWLSFLAGISEDVWEVAVNTFADPIKGLSTVFQKIAMRAKEEKAQGGRS